jgi:hypothetical protein
MDFELRCKTLIATRYSQLEKIYSKAKRYTVNIQRGFTQDESMEYLRLCLHEKKMLPQAAYEIHKKCKGNPFVMALIGKNLAEYKGSQQRWDSWVNSLNSYQLSEEINIPIKESLNSLKEEDQKLFKRMVIFKEEIKIPLRVS